jgi:hypothetical protein
MPYRIIKGHASAILLLLAYCTSQLASASGGGECARQASTPHSGTFIVEKSRGDKDMPNQITGKWNITVDAKSCEIKGTVVGELIGTVNVKGKYGNFKPIGSSFDAEDIFFQDAEHSIYSKFETFAFGPPMQGNPPYVNIVSPNFTYRGKFKGD